MDDKERFRLAVEIVNLHRESYDPYELDFHDSECDRPSWTYGEPPANCTACLAEWSLEREFINRLDGVDLICDVRRYIELYEKVTELHYPITSLSDEDQALVLIVHQEKKRRREQIEYQGRCDRRDASIVSARERRQATS
jgi:hypothetical protein